MIQDLDNSVAFSRWVSCSKLSGEVLAGGQGMPLSTPAADRAKRMVGLAFADSGARQAGKVTHCQESAYRPLTSSSGLAALLPEKPGNDDKRAHSRHYCVTGAPTIEKQNTPKPHLCSGESR